MKSISIIMLLAMFISTVCKAEETQSPGDLVKGDGRQWVAYPPEVKAHALANMRSHLQALANITEALSKGQYEQAADIASSRLGMNSMAATACRMNGGMDSMPMSGSEHLDHLMSQLMPEGMREKGRKMHRAADEFAAAAHEAGKTGDASSAIAALARVMQRCTACHASYRMR